MRAAIPAFILIALGVIFLGVNTGYIQAVPLRTLLATWWPVVLILVGISLLFRKR
jgi:lipopolysaccharide export LptBFGC system permease protein LptF